MSDFIAYIPRFDLNNFCFYLALYLPMHLQQREKTTNGSNKVLRVLSLVHCLITTPQLSNVCSEAGDSVRSQETVCL